MKNLYALDKFRVTSADVLTHYGTVGDNTCGVFVVPSPVDRQSLGVIASAGGRWDHVSVSRKARCPTWAELEHVKRLFFADDETAMQLHVPSTGHISVHPFCLHLWRPQNEVIPLPPSIFVGPIKGGGQGARGPRVVGPVESLTEGNVHADC